MEKKKIMIASGSKETQESIKAWVEMFIPNSFCIMAVDGSDAISKIQNDSPHVVITSIDLAKTDGYKLTQWVIRCKPEEKIAIVLLTPVPPEERFVDEVVTSQVQFADLSKGEAELKRILEKAVKFSTQVSVPQDFFTKMLIPGEQLIKEGEKADYVYLVKKGELNATSVRDGTKIILGKVMAGEFVGEMSYINGEPRSADVFADTECELIAVPVNILDQVLFTKPAWAKALMKTLTKRIKSANKKAS